MTLISVSSSWVDAYLYEGGTLFVRFKGGTLVRYDDVPFDLWFEFLQATSKGRFVHDHLINRPYTVVS